MVAPGAAQAETRGFAGFPPGTLVTHWSLQFDDGTPAALPEPVFVAPPSTVSSHPPSGQTIALVQPAKPVPPAANGAAPASSKEPSPAHAAAISGPTIDGEPYSGASGGKGFTKYDGAARYRMPSTIKQLEISFQLLNAVDAVSTVVCLHRSDCQEDNPIYGKHPSTLVVVGGKALTGLVHYWAMRSLLPDHPGMAKAFGWFSVTLQGTVVGLNMSQLF